MCYVYTRVCKDIKFNSSVEMIFMEPNAQTRDFQHKKFSVKCISMKFQKALKIDLFENMNLTQKHHFLIDKKKVVL